MHTHSLSIHPDSGRALRPWELALLLAVCVTLLAGTWAQARSQMLAARLVRLHVIAVSDDETEQAVKLQVRDAVLAYLEPQLQDVTDVNAARQLIAGDLDGIARAAQAAASMFRSLGRRRTKRSSGPRKPQTQPGPGTMIASIFPVLMSKSTSPTKPRRLQSFTFITSRCLSSQIRIDINLPDPSVIKICTKGPGGSSWTGISIYFYFVTSDNVTLSKCSV